MLNEKITIYVPSTKNGNQESDNSEYTDSALLLLSLLCGGATMQKSVGCWHSKEHGLIKESVDQVYAYTDSADSVWNTVLQFANYLKLALTQESIAIEKNGTLYLI